MWWLGFNLSVAVAVGFIALAGVAAESEVVMLIYLDNALTELKQKRALAGSAFTHEDLYDAIMFGAFTMLLAMCQRVLLAEDADPLLPRVRGLTRRSVSPRPG
jgi:Cu/Ag efflux pump CusA